jgi:hypothetical protein
MLVLLEEFRIAGQQETPLPHFGIQQVDQDVPRVDTHQVIGAEFMQRPPQVGDFEHEKDAQGAQEAEGNQQRARTSTQICRMYIEGVGHRRLTRAIGSS